MALHPKPARYRHQRWSCGTNRDQTCMLKNLSCSAIDRAPIRSWPFPEDAVLQELGAAACNPGVSLAGAPDRMHAGKEDIHFQPRKIAKYFTSKAVARALALPSRKCLPGNAAVPSLLLPQRASCLTVYCSIRFTIHAPTTKSHAQVVYSGAYPSEGPTRLRFRHM